MENKRLKATIYFILLAFLCMACKANLLPNVKQPLYKMYNYGDEKGFQVSFKLSKSSTMPTAVVINKLKQPISESDRVGDTYKVNVIAQSRKIFGFKPQVVEKDNGIYFKKSDGTEEFRPIDFKLVTK